MRTLFGRRVLDECDTFVVLNLEVDSFFNQILDHIDFVVFDRVEHWCLAVVVHVIKITSQTCKFFSGINKAVADAIEDRGLSINVYLVQTETLLNEPVNYIRVALEHRVEKRSLVE